MQDYMSKMDVWWWLATPYSVAFPLMVLLFRIRAEVGHALAVFLLLSILSTCFSVAWAFVTIRRSTRCGKVKCASGTKIRVGLVVLAVLLWAIVFTDPN